MVSQSFKILSLDGGGSKGVYTLGVLGEIEALIKKPLFEEFRLIYGTSTGALIGSLIALGHSIESITKLYFAHIPEIMNQCSKSARSKMLKKIAKEIFGEKNFTDFKTNVGIVSTNYGLEQPMIFKSSANLAQGQQATFVPGFGCKIWEAVLASTAAFPYFDRVKVKTTNQDEPELIDGGFVANNPTLFALSDATNACKQSRESIKILNIGVGHYRDRPITLWQKFIQKTWPAQLMAKILGTNANSMEKLRSILFPDVKCIRISESFPDEQFETNLLEHNPKKLLKLKSLGRNSFGKFEEELKTTFGW